MSDEFFDLGDGHAVRCNPGGRFHGWLFRRHPDGQYVSVRKLEIVEQPYDPLFVHMTPKVDACDHEFGGWREHADGRGGEQFCRKCGMGAMEHTLRSDPT